MTEDTPGFEGVADLLPTNRLRGLDAFAEDFGLLDDEASDIAKANQVSVIAWSRSSTYD